MMLLKLFKNYKNSVGTAIVLVFFSFILLTTIVFTLINYKRQFQNQITSLNLRLDQIQVGFIQALSNSLWKIDDEQTNIILESILRQEDVELVRVIDQSSTLYELGSLVRGEDAINRLYPLIVNLDGEKKHIADLEIIATKSNMEKLLRDEIFFTIATELLKVALFMLGSLSFMRLIITRHLDTITGFFAQNNIYRSQKKLILNRDGEFWKKSEDNFDVLVSSINVMIEKLHGELQERKKIEHELTSLNEDLEQRVDEKTKQLLDSGRIEAVVELSAGIAHEINSPLSVVFGLNKRLEKLIKSDTLDAKELTTLTAILRKSINRIFSITNALHTLSNVSEFEVHRKMNTSILIAETMEGISEIFKSSIGRINYLAVASVLEFRPRQVSQGNWFYPSRE